MEMIKDGWFHEINHLWPGQCTSLQIEEILYHEKSKYQDVLVFQSTNYGKVLVLDGVIQCTERDEFSYQEMITHLPLCSHPNPESVLVIGGGDGGVVREALKHECVKNVVQCEIDQVVIDVCKKYLPTMTSGYGNPRLTQIIGDGFEFVQKHPKSFDVIITDSSDEGPANVLFQSSYYSHLREALKPGGIICSQDDGMWLSLDSPKRLMKHCRTLFPRVDYAYCTIPSFPCGQIGFIMSSLDEETNFREPRRILTQDEVSRMKMRYYNPAIHRAAFIFPEFAVKELAE